MPARQTRTVTGSRQTVIGSRAIFRPGIDGARTIRTKPCTGCKAIVPDIEGPTHRYMESSPGCWAAYGEVLAREYSNALFMKNHRLTVDAYAAQHPGKPSPQSIQSIAVHLLGLYLVIEQGVGQSSVTRLMPAMARHKKRFRWLEPPQSPGDVSVKDVLAASSAAEHRDTVLRWARSVWQAWAAHHHTVREWHDLVYPR